MNAEDATVGMRVVCTVPGEVIERGEEGEVLATAFVSLGIRWDRGLWCWCDPEDVEPATAERGTPWGDFVLARNALIRSLHEQGRSCDHIQQVVSMDRNAVIRITETEEKA